MKGDFMNLPKIEICIEGYDVEQTDFILSMLIEKNENLTKLYEEAKEQIAVLTETNEKLHKDFLTLTKQFSDTVSSTDSLIYEKLSVTEKKIDSLISAVNSKNDLDEIHKQFDKSNQTVNDKINSPTDMELSDFRDDLKELKSLFGSNL